VIGQREKAGTPQSALGTEGNVFIPHPAVVFALICPQRQRRTSNQSCVRFLGERTLSVGVFCAILFQMPLLRALGWSVFLVLCCSCTTTRFLWQAAGGQWELATKAEPIPEVLADPKTPERTREFLNEVQRIKKFGERFGLNMHENYQEFVQLDRRYVVWFVNASAPLAFEPKTFWFPVVGSFPGLGWFDEDEALDFVEDLEQDGWDVNIRGVTAFSTGGWFDDPIVSSMFSDDPAALGLLVNTVLHESVHATVLAANQQYFNESLASFVANDLAPRYLVERFGPDNEELQKYREAMDFGERNFKLMSDANQQLTALYASPLSAPEKLARKKQILKDLHAKIPFVRPPNNATLIGVQLYNEGKAEMAALRERCGDWPRFLAAVDSLRTEHFGAPQSAIIGPALDGLTKRGCRPHPKKKRTIWQPQVRRQRERQERYGDCAAIRDSVRCRTLPAN
jgi:predicted aminopeptidase